MAECKQCGSCCKHLPGFFLPNGEELLVEVAKHLNISLENLKENYLLLDYRAPFGKKVWFWTPRMIDSSGNPLVPEDHCSLEEYPKKAEEIGREGGHCIFYSNNQCLIQPVKPLTCKIYNCQGEDYTGRIYYQYFGGEPTTPEEKILINQGDWATCWDFYCPCCLEDEAEYTGVSVKEKIDYYEVKCQKCGYQFWVY